MTLSTDEINKKKTRRHIEESEQTAFFDWLAYYPAIRKVTFAVPNGGHRDKKVYIRRDGKKIVWSPEAKRLKNAGVLRGVTDCVMTIPTYAYHGLFMEFKTKTGALTKEQKSFINSVVPLGYACVIVKSCIEAKEEVEKYFCGQSLRAVNDMLSNGTYTNYIYDRTRV